ncbi:MAG: hypothetical protein IK016_06135, partial [Lachnospiraceae bacterium]|nr:hypothetical protein [Lachnospiraceae bacterium]
ARTHARTRILRYAVCPVKYFLQFSRFPWLFPASSIPSTDACAGSDSGSTPALFRFISPLSLNIIYITKPRVLEVTNCSFFL